MMTSSRKTRLAAIIGLILIFSTVVLFMGVFQEQKQIHWVSLLFLVLGEGLPIAGFIRLADRPEDSLRPGLRVGIYSLFFVYGLAAVSLPLFFLLFGGAARLLAITEVILLLAFGLILLLAAAGGGAGQGSAGAMASVVFMRGLEADIKALSLEPANQRYRRQLNQIAEAVRYSDYAGVSSVDEGLREKLRELSYVLREDGETEASGGGDAEKQVDLLTEDILRLLRQRGREIKESKGRKG
jgi:hypothetical protein